MTSELITALAALELKWRADAAEDAAHGFAEAAKAQADCAGDLQALLEAGRRMAVVRREEPNVD